MIELLDILKNITYFLSNVKLILVTNNYFLEINEVIKGLNMNLHNQHLTECERFKNITCRQYKCVKCMENNNISFPPILKLCSVSIAIFDELSKVLLGKSFGNFFLAHRKK